MAIPSIDEGSEGRSEAKINLTDSRLEETSEGACTSMGAANCLRLLTVAVMAATSMALFATSADSLSLLRHIEPSQMH